jgi:uncharacterized lipoprotein YajG
MNKLTLLTCFLLSACATQPNYIAVKNQCPAIKLPAEPDYPVYHLNKGDPASVVTKAYVVSFKMARDHYRMALEKTEDK